MRNFKQVPRGKFPEVLIYCGDMLSAADMRSTEYLWFHGKTQEKTEKPRFEESFDFLGNRTQW